MNLNLLVSYAYLQGKKSRARWFAFVERMKPYTKVMLDSGGYTIATSGIDISVDDYITDLHDGMKDLFWQYVSLDEPMNWPKSKAMVDTMVAADLKPMCVLTQDAAVEEAVELVEINPYICLAGGVHEDLRYYMNRIDTVHALTEGDARVHGLGFTSALHPARTKAFTIDSSTWSVGKQFGNFTVFDPHRGCTQFNTKKLLSQRQFRNRPEIRKLFMKHGIQMPMLRALINGETRSRSSGSIIDILTCRAWFEYSRFMQRRGITFFFATSSLAALSPLFAVAKAELEGTRLVDAEDFSWYLHGLVKTDFPKFLDEVEDVLKRLEARPV